MATYSIVAVSRTPQSATGPVLVELGPVYGSLSYVETLDEAGECAVTVDLEAIQEDIKLRLQDTAGLPLELWVYRDSVKVFAGPIVGGEIKDTRLTMTARSAIFYTAYMLVETAKAWSSIDEYTIATDVIDDWQVQTFGNYGIDTSAIGTSGTTRSLSIPGNDEPRIVYDVLRDLAGMAGYDFWVDPTDDELKLGPKGSDLSASVFLELGVVSPAIKFTAAPGVIASEVYAASSGGATVLTTSKVNTAMREAWGRAGVAVTVDDDPDATTLGDAAQEVLDTRNAVLFVPGPELIPVSGAGVDDFEVGDTVTYTFDAGLGQQTGSYRIRKKQITVLDNGQEKMAVEFI